MDVIMVGVAAMGLGKEWLGRHLDDKSVKELMKISDKYRFDPTGEGGEFDTLVLDAPMYKKRIKLLKYKVEWKLDRGRLIIEDAKLEVKGFARKA